MIMTTMFHRIIVRLGFVVAAHYIGLLPVALFGVWVNYLIPSWNWFLVFPHLILMGGMTLFGVRSRKLFIAPVLLLLSSVLVSYPQMSVILTDLNGDWMRLLAGLLGPLAYLVLSSLAFFLLYRRHGDWADLEVRGAKA